MRKDIKTKRKIIVFLEIAVLWLFPLLGLFAVSGPPGLDIEIAFQKITGLVFDIAIAIAVFFIVVAGFYFVTAGGEPANIEKAKKIFLWTIVGLFVAVASKAIINWINDLVIKLSY